ncbi:uncharacterized protein ACIBXB_019779 [Morphnus guianensis]
MALTFSWKSLQSSTTTGALYLVKLSSSPEPSKKTDRSQQGLSHRSDNSHYTPWRPAIQLVLHPASHQLTYLTVGQLVQKDVLGGGAEHREPPHSFLGDAKESLAANSQKGPWRGHHSSSHCLGRGAPQCPSVFRLLCSPKPSTLEVGTGPKPRSPGTLLGARAELTAGHGSSPSLLGSANLCHLPGQEQPFPAAWAPLSGWAAQAPPAGMAPQSAPAPLASPAHPSPRQFSRGRSASPREHPCPRLGDACPLKPICRELPKYLGPPLPFHLLEGSLRPNVQPRPTSTAAHPVRIPPHTSSPRAWRTAGGCRPWGVARRVPLQSPPGPARLPLTHAGLQRAPCGCLFDPRVYHIQWTATNLPPPASATLGQGAASLPGAALGGAWGCGAPPQYLAPYEHQARAVAPAPTGLLMSIPVYQHIHGQLLKIETSGTATPAGAPPGSHVPPGSDVPPSPCAAPHNQALEDPAGDLEVSEEMLLQEALRLFGCSLDAVGDSQDAPSSSPVPGHPGGTSGEGTGVAPACPVLPTSIPGYQHIEGQLEITTSGTATPAGAPPGSDVPPGSDIPPSPSAAPHSQALGDPAGDLAVSEEMLLEEALRLFGCSSDTVGASQGGPISSPVPGHPSGTSREGTGVAPACPVLPTSITGYQHIEGQLEINSSGTATPAGAPPGSDIPPGSDVPPSPCAAPHTESPGDIAGALAVPDGVLLEEALRLLGCSLDTVGASQDRPSSSPVPGDTGGTGTATPDWDLSPLSLPEELLSPDSCIPELSDPTLSLETFHGIGMEPQEPQEDAGMDLPPSLSAVAEEPRKRQAQSSLPMPPSKRRALADNRGV